MAPVIPHGVPAELVAGDSLIFKDTFPLFPVGEGWTLSWSFTGAGVLRTLSAEVTDDSSATYTVNVPASRTAELPEGTYPWTAFATGSGTYAGRRDVAARGVLVLKPNPAAALAGELRSHEERELELLLAALLESAGSDVVMYMIGNRQVQRSRGEAVRRKAQLERAIWRQQNPGKAYPSAVGVFSAY